MKKIIIGLTAGRKYDNYLRWLALSPEVEVIKLGHEERNLESVNKCRGIILSGGEDVHPRLYGKPEYVQQFGLHDFDVERDGFEMEVVSYADQHELSILGICRGLQVVNVFFGGTLVPDIPSFGNPDHMRFADEVDRRHTIAVREKSFLRSITAAKGEVNSAHHQSADLLGEGLVANAYCDKVVEGLERSNLDNPFLLLVQWHPERMIDQQSVFSKNIRESFIESCQ